MSGKFGAEYHGMCGTPEYNAYRHAKARCTCPSNEYYRLYGAVGIKFLFNSFQDFYKELGARPKGLTLERINNNGNYEVGNVKWATMKEQSNNRCAHGNKKVLYVKGIGNVGIGGGTADVNETSNDQSATDAGREVEGAGLSSEVTR